MIIIVNGDDAGSPGNDFISSQDFKKTTSDIFTAGSKSEQKAALTMIHNLISFPNYMQEETWMTFTPEDIIKEEKFVRYLWQKLPHKQNIFKSQNELAEFMVKSYGSSNVIREMWNKYLPSNMHN